MNELRGSGPGAMAAAPARVGRPEANRQIKAEEKGGQANMLKKVLVVDDSELIHNMYRLMLKKYGGCEILKAMHGREGLEVLAEHRDMDLILLDINMPVMNGLQFLERVKKDPALQRIPVIIISTEGKEEDTMRGLSMGASGYIVKPFKSIMLHNLIEAIIKKRTAAAI
jgi:two-component system chemotaxis response regulator CheY